MGPTFAEVRGLLSSVHWTPLSGTEARLAWRGVASGQIEYLFSIDGGEFFRLGEAK